MEEIKKSLKGNFPLIAALSSIGYLMYYFYQLSIANYYGYPEEYIVFDLGTLLRTFAFFFILGLIVIAPMFLYSALIGKRWLVVIFALTLTCIYFNVFAFVNPLTFFGEGKAIKMSTLFGYVTIPILSFYIILSYFDEVRHPQSGLFVTIILAFLIYSGPNYVGSFYSYAKPQYFLMEKNREYVLLSSIGGRMVFGSCDKSGVRFLQKDSSSEEVLIPVKSKEEIIKIRDCFYNRGLK
ncbi:hypothetical protein [Enterobacter cloacae]|uniref:hypothetical protein n=2 Tax=Enterobacter cloacae TaxID=550 RepID=UPI0006695B5C|nr:hypothetical protein [Enterobacter cloacae]SSH75287.1 Uncharacterised protein [Klebsiella pneumoniae]NBC60341.1 hypothetical protein [Enterobacter cloacae]HAS1006819.1 hypothetical protein [Enterobacter cloacae]HAS1148127.1 hypothetical protein [Enterobacter cloacae]HAS1181460.1 hypothetical protein [Enterobacter cloacae]